jgi:hypothetical protein
MGGVYLAESDRATPTVSGATAATVRARDMGRWLVDNCLWWLPRTHTSLPLSGQMTHTHTHNTHMIIM